MTNILQLKVKAIFSCQISHSNLVRCHAVNMHDPCKHIDHQVLQQV